LVNVITIKFINSPNVSNLIKLINMKIQMKSRNVLVSLIAIVATVFLIATVSAATITDPADVFIFVDGSPSLNALSPLSVTPGETISVKVVFTAADSDPTKVDIYENVRVEAEINGEDDDTETETGKFDAIEGTTYKKTLRIDVPDDLDDDLDAEYELEITIKNKDDRVVVTFPLTVQRESFKFDIAAINTPQSVEAGDTLPVDVVLTNTGRRNLDEIFVTASLPGLGVQRTVFFPEDLVAIEDEDLPGVDEDDEDTIVGRVLLSIPDNAEAGIYSLEVDVDADDGDATASRTTQIVIENEFLGNEVIATVTGKSATVGEDAEFQLLIVNPSDSLKVYKVIPETSEGLTTSVSASVLAIPAGSSKTVSVIARASDEGTYNFGVNVFEGDNLLNKVTFTSSVKGSSAVGSSNPVVVLTIVLAIIFIVLLIVLIALLSRKPEKSEEFGESYY
jgi:hypothetical protein